MQPQVLFHSCLVVQDLILQYIRFQKTTPIYMLVVILPTMVVQEHTELY